MRDQSQYVKPKLSNSLVFDPDPKGGASARSDSCYSYTEFLRFCKRRATRSRAEFNLPDLELRFASKRHDPDPCAGRIRECSNGLLSATCREPEPTAT